MRLLLLIISFAVLSSQWVIYRKNNQKRKIICKTEIEWDNSTQAAEGSDSSESEEQEGRVRPEIRITRRVRRDVEIDPDTKEPIIFLGPKSNVSSTFVDDGDFDIVSDHLSDDELKFVKEQIMNTCNYLDRQRHQTRKVKTVEKGTETTTKAGTR